MEFLIISGQSGAGKSRTADILEDLDFYCVDNMPVVLIPKFAELCLATRGRYDRVALVTDIRERNSFDELFTALDDLRALGLDYKILFVEANGEAIVKRYKETRRRHPLAPEGGSIEEAVGREKRLLAPVRERADYVLDTTGFTLGNLQNEIYGLFIGERSDKTLTVNLISFGFKYGIPMEADLVFDVRFLPNPFYNAQLRDLSGLDEPITEFVFHHDEARKFMNHLTEMISFLLPLYVEEGKFSLSVAIGCTGGRHRSVAIAEALGKYLESIGYPAHMIHRDIYK